MLALSSCLSTIPIRRAVLAYDETADRVSTDLLLTNIARAHHHRPLHFTAISSVAATYNLEFTMGATPPLGGVDAGVKLSPFFGGSVAENPTITLVPVEGEEFNQRVLTPMSETQFGLLLEQGTDLGLMLRMMAAEYRADERGDDDQIVRNRPRRGPEYEEFRRRVLHLSSLHTSHQLFVDKIVIEQTIEVDSADDEDVPVILEALENGYRWDADGAGGRLSRKLPGRLVMTNYDLDQLDRAGRRQLYQEALALDDNAILVDVREAGPGGDWPMHGSFRLRGFLAILNFLGRGIDEEREYAVDPDPRTGWLRLNPPQTLAIHVGTEAPEDAMYSVDFQALVYSISPAEADSEGADTWNLEAFRLLSQLYELSVHPSEFSKPAPAITIAK